MRGAGGCRQVLRRGRVPSRTAGQTPGEAAPSLLLPALLPALIPAAGRARRRDEARRVEGGRRGAGLSSAGHRPPRTRQPGRPSAEPGSTPPCLPGTMRPLPSAALRASGAVGAIRLVYHLPCPPLAGSSAPAHRPRLRCLWSEGSCCPFVFSLLHRSFSPTDSPVPVVYTTLTTDTLCQKFGY